MTTKTFHYASLALRILEKVLGSNFSVSGIEKLPKHPVLFVANHFTRSETFFVPYLIHRYSGRQVRCLADSGLYHGALGKFLESVGTVSTRNKDRDKIILKDLVDGEYDWMIYPEGSMIKSKEIKNDNILINYTPHRIGPVRTGSAVLALKSELYRQDVVEACENKDAERLRFFERNFDIFYQEHLKEINTCIVPLNISYYPLRPGNNKIKSAISRLVKKIPKQIAEELEIEGNLLLGSEIHLSFGDPINLGKYIKNTKKAIYRIPIVKDETKVNLILKYLKTRLTNDFMIKVYSATQVNFDHIFGASLKYIGEDEIDISHLKRVIYLSGVMIQKYGGCNVNESIFESNLVKLFYDEKCKSFDDIFSLAKKHGVIKQISDSRIRVNRSLFEKKYDFHEVRIENSLQVITNEFSLLTKASDIVRRNARFSNDKLKRKVFKEIYRRDLESFNSAYDIYFDDDFSKDRSVGSPFFIEQGLKKDKEKKSSGILLVHGYNSAPKEVEFLANFLRKFNIKIYIVRLEGHGTSPLNLRDTTWKDWYESVQRGYAALSNVCSDIAIIGFSTGGLLSLLSAARKNPNMNKISGIIVINAALKLMDIRSHLVSGINIWNDLLEGLSLKKGQLEYVENKPENPHINYHRNYLKGVNQLGNLMNKVDDSLSKITNKILIIQAKKDPIVKPISGQLIYKKISSKEKELQELDFENHVIITGPGKEKVFEIIEKFLSKIKVI